MILIRLFAKLSHRIDSPRSFMICTTPYKALNLLSNIQYPNLTPHCKVENPLSKDYVNQ